MADKAEKTRIMHGFNETFFDFMDDAIRIIPNNQKIIGAKNSFNLIKMASPSAIIKVWYQYIYQKYADQIDAGDLSFFFEKDYSEDLNVLSNSNDILTIIDSIRNPLRTTSDVNKEHTKKYIQILSKLSVLYCT
jgi:hypothetical protein